MLNEGLGSWPARRARKTPHRTAFIHDDLRLTYADLHKRTTRLAHVMRGLGVTRGDRVSYLGPNHPSFLEAFFAAGLLGAVFVPLNTRLTAAELRYQVDDCGAALLLHAAEYADLLPEGVPALVVADCAYEELLASESDRRIDEPVALEDISVVIYTSGTTGRPKGAALTHANLTWNAFNVLIDTNLGHDERAMAVAPLFHAAGLCMLALPVLLKGGTCVLASSFDPARTLRLIAQHRITFMFGVPTMYDQLRRQAEWLDTDLSCLRTLICGGSPVPASLIAAYQARGLTLQQGYGLTEASPGALLLGSEHPTDKAGTAGVPHFFSEVRVVRRDLTHAEPGEVGEVQIHGPHVMHGYWRAPAATDETFIDGWLRTGDGAVADADGYVTIVDRFRDVIISGGENIYPAEVEEALLFHPDIVDCAVIGVPDDKWGQVGRAVLVAREGTSPDPGHVLHSLGGRIAKYKIPKTAILVGALPRTAAGKIIKSAVQRLYGAAG